MLHHEFITKTDKRSLFKQIKNLVDCGKESYQQDQAIRRNKIHDLIDNEDKVFEDEFIEKIEQRVERDIRIRKNYLLKNKELREKELQTFVASKRLHQSMLNCLDIREELLKKDNRQTQIIQLYQMDDKLREQNRQKREDEFWQRVQNRVNERFDENKEKEDCLKKALQDNERRVNDMQVEEQKKEKRMDLARINKEMEEIQRQSQEIDDKEKKAEILKAKNREAKLAVKQICEQQQLFKEEAQNYEETFHSEIMKQVNNEIEEAKLKNMRLRQDIRSYLEYLKKYHDFVAEEERNRNALEDEGNKRYNCMKRAQRQRLFAGKRQIAEASHQMLLKQICEDQARKMRIEAAEKEKLPEYPFPKVKLVDKLKNRLKVKKDLEDQMEEMKRYREMKQKEFEAELKRAEDDNKFCAEVLERHKAEGVDFLPTHPNWIYIRNAKPEKHFCEDNTNRKVCH